MIPGQRNSLTRCLSSGLVVLFLLSISAPYASGSTQKIGADLYAYISENDSSANSTFLVSEQGILVVDTGLNEQEVANC